MRWRGVLVLAILTACKADSYAVLDLDDVPATAASLEVVLAHNKDNGYTGTHLLANDARGVIGGGDVDYFKQVDAFTSLDLDKRLIEIEPAAGDTDARYQPFVIARDASNAIVALGIFNDESGTAGTIETQAGTQREYPIHLETVYPPPSGATEIGYNEAVEVFCDDGSGSNFSSGFAWQRNAGGQHRVLFPQTGLDASARPFDLDCDGFEVANFIGGGSDGSGAPTEPATDCDDTSSDVYPQALNTTCTGPTNNCAASGSDGIVACSATDAMCVSARACADTASSCPASSCACKPDALGLDCASCILAYTAIADDVQPCQPAVGSMIMLPCADCSVTVQAVTPAPWTATATVTGSSMTLTIASATRDFVQPPTGTVFVTVFVSYGEAGGLMTTLPVNIYLTSHASTSCPAGSAVMSCLSPVQPLPG